MDLKDLKSAWNTYSSQEMDKHRLGSENIHELLKTRTKTLVDKIDRNLRIGLVVLLAFIVWVIFDNFYLSAFIIPDNVEYPRWLFPLDAFSMILIVTTYLFFVLRYIKIRRSFSIDLQLRDLLNGIMDTLKTYRRMFYLAVIFLLINIVISFAAGLYQGVKLKADAANIAIENLALSKILLVSVVGLFVLFLIVGLTFIVLRWGFNKLYGRYMLKLQETIQELDEPGDAGNEKD